MGRRPVHVTTWGGTTTPPNPALRALLVHGTLTWATACFAGQQPLAERYQLDLMDRRGFGDSPDIAHSDYEVDAEDIAALLGTGAHLVAHSYGDAGAMLAASRRPEAVRSLTLIEPSVLRTAEGDPVVDAALVRIRAAFGAEREPMSPEEYLRYSTQAYGLPLPELTARRLRATASAMAERPVWDARIPLEPLAAARFPKVVLNGTWETAHPGYREFVGESLMACGRRVAQRIGARHVRIPGADHSPHLDQAGRVNEVLARTWGPGPGPRP